LKAKGGITKQKKPPATPKMEKWSISKTKKQKISKVAEGSYLRKKGGQGETQKSVKGQQPKKFTERKK